MKYKRKGLICFEKKGLAAICAMLRSTYSQLRYCGSKILGNTIQYAQKIEVLDENIVFEKQKDSKALTNSKTHFEVVWINPFNLFF